MEKIRRSGIRRKRGKRGKGNDFTGGVGSRSSCPAPPPP